MDIFDKILIPSNEIFSKVILKWLTISYVFSGRLKIGGLIEIIPRRRESDYQS